MAVFYVHLLGPGDYIRKPTVQNLECIKMPITVRTIGLWNCGVPIRLVVGIGYPCLWVDKKRSHWLFFKKNSGKWMILTVENRHDILAMPGQALPQNGELKIKELRKIWTPQRPIDKSRAFHDVVWVRWNKSVKCAGRQCNVDRWAINVMKN